jgi:GMP synthase-like glutamine amidotransferase
VLGRSLALQFHPELDHALLLRWLADDRDGDGDIAKLGVDEHELLTRTDALQDSATRQVHELVRGFVTRVDDGARR